VGQRGRREPVSIYDRSRNLNRGPSLATGDLEASSRHSRRPQKEGLLGRLRGIDQQEEHSRVDEFIKAHQ
jgi:hypothetical protein